MIENFSTTLKTINYQRLFILICFGQLLSFCITSTSVISTKLSVDYMVSIPTTQTFLNYVFLSLVYVSIIIKKQSLSGFFEIIKKRGIYYFFLALCDVEGNYFVVKAYNYTTLLSAMLIDSWAIPVVMALSYILLKTRYRIVQFVGVAICLIGLILLVVSDSMTGRDYPAQNKLLGDFFCLIGATFYGISNVLEEIAVRKQPIWEVIGMLGFFGTFINAFQLLIFELNELKTLSWSADVVGLILTYNVAMFILYSLTPILLRKSSAIFFNLSILTSDFYGLVLGILIFHYHIIYLYGIAYVLTILGIIIYNVFTPTSKPPDIAEQVISQRTQNYLTYISENQNSKDVKFSPFYKS